jgi:hypothetical protein
MCPQSMTQDYDFNSFLMGLFLVSPETKNTTFVWLPDMVLWSILSAITLIDTSLQKREEDFFSPFNPMLHMVPHPETLLSFLFL